MEERKRLEKEFHDRLRLVTGDEHVADTRWTPELEDTIGSNPNWANMKYYSIERKSREMVLKWFEKNCENKRVLDYCCGNGEDGICIADYGAREVIGIDISDNSVENCVRNARKRGVEDRTTYLVADAEATGFDDNSFDIITEYGSLHHLDLDKAFAELARIVKHDGKIICNEVLRHNFIIHTYRKLTPHLRTAWEVEHILGKKDFDVAKRYFHSVDIHFYHLFTLLAVPLRKTAFFETFLSVMEKFDNIILRLPLIKWQAWQVVFVLSEPRK